MKNLEKDEQFRRTIKKIKLEAPAPDFSSRVMDAVIAEAQKKEMFKADPLLGRRFWIIIFLFVALTAFFIFVSGTLETAADSPGIFSRINGPDLSDVKNSWSLFIDKLSGIPLTVAGILLAASMLLLADKYFGSGPSPSFQAKS